MDEPKPRRKLAPRLALLAISSLVAIGAGEFGFRLLLGAQDRPYDGSERLAEARRNLDTVAAFTPKDTERPASIPEDRVLHPYFGSESGPDPGGVLRHFGSTPPDAAFEVLVVGGSVAMLFANHAARDLEAALEADPLLAGRDVKVLNGAHAAYKQPQQLNKVAYLLAQGFVPDVVVNLDGFNETANGIRNGLTGTNPLYPTAPVWAGLFWGREQESPELAEKRAALTSLGLRYRATLERAERWGLFRSAITGTMIGRQLTDLHQRRATLQEELIQAHSPQETGRRRAASREQNGDAYEREVPRIVDLAVTAWRECSISLAALCEARGIHYVHALQPTLWDEGAKPVSKEEEALSGPKEWRRGVKLGYPRLRAEIPNLEAHGIEFLDLSRAFADVEETLYFDPCHYGPEGSRMLVDDVARAILATL